MRVRWRTYKNQVTAHTQESFTLTGNFECSAASPDHVRPAMAVLVARTGRYSGHGGAVDSRREFAGFHLVRFLEPFLRERPADSGPWTFQKKHLTLACGEGCSDEPCAPSLRDLWSRL